VLLRASGQFTGNDYDLRAVLGEGDGGVPHGRLLTLFAEAVLDDDDAALDAVRSELRQTLGDEALVDTAGVIATFNSIDRVADATGIPLEEKKAEVTADFRAELGLDGYTYQEGAAQEGAAE
jgi:hypothetical protein|tara:strand:- start:378 stop:743 length:366 start_codon:yes stop_codon:yes gene_type:complete